MQGLAQAARCPCLGCVAYAGQGQRRVSSKVQHTVGYTCVSSSRVKRIHLQTTAQCKASQPSEMGLLDAERQAPDHQHYTGYGDNITACST